MRYESVYPFRVIEELRHGNAVYVLDRQRNDFDRQNVYSSRDLSVYELFELLADAENDKSGRFVFWKEVEE